MQKLSPLMKGLVETRARADAEYAKATSAVEERTAHLARLTATFEVQCRLTQRSITQAQKQAETALQAREACDNLIKSINKGINPLAIEPVRAWQGRYGNRGALGKLVQAIVESAYPNEISTQEVSQELQLRLGLRFSTPAERYAWQRVSVRGRLNYLYRLGLLERLHDTSGKSSETGRWRALPPKNQQESLAAQAAQAGISTTCTLDQDQLEPESGPEEDDLPR